jgi:hypothetical protein
LEGGKIVSEEVKDGQEAELSAKDMFADELKMLEDETQVTEDLYSELKQHFDAVKNSRNSGALKFIADQAKNLISLRMQKVSLVKERVSIKKIAQDLDLKAKGKDGGVNNTAELREIVKMITGTIDIKPQDVVNPETNISSDDEDALEARFRELEASGQIVLDGDFKKSSTLMEEESVDEGLFEEEPEVKIVVDEQGNKYVVNNDYEVQDGYDIPEFEITYKEIDGELHAFDDEGDELEIIEI